VRGKGDRGRGFRSEEGMGGVGIGPGVMWGGKEGVRFGERLVLGGEVSNCHGGCWPQSAATEDGGCARR